MQRPRFRSTLRRMMIAVAIAGLDLWAIVETSRFYPLPARPLPIATGNGRGLIRHGSDGSVYRYRGNAETGYRLVSVEYPPPTLLRVWAPLIGSVTGTVLVIAWLVARDARHRVTPDPFARG